jgi:hypothetical protein
MEIIGSSTELSDLDCAIFGFSPGKARLVPPHHREFCLCPFESDEPVAVTGFAIQRVSKMDSSSDNRQSIVQQQMRGSGLATKLLNILSEHAGL